jgi:hypothetical protein
MIRVLIRNEGIQTPEQANDLLESGDYRSLDEEEFVSLYPPRALSSAALTASQQPSPSTQMTETSINYTQPGESSAPSTRSLDTCAIYVVALKTILWLLTWEVLWRMINPLITWPLQNAVQIRTAIVLSAGGTFLAPFLVGVLTNTKDNVIWKNERFQIDLPLRILTYISAAAGFSTGYLLSFLLLRIGQQYGFIQPGDIFSRLSAAVSLILGYCGAKQIPMIQFRVNRSLNLKKDWLFLIFFSVSPLWCLYQILTSPWMFLVPIVVILLALSVNTISNIQQRTDKKIRLL